MNASLQIDRAIKTTTVEPRSKVPTYKDASERNPKFSHLHPSLSMASSLSSSPFPPLLPPCIFSFPSFRHWWWTDQYNSKILANLCICYCTQYLHSEIQCLLMLYLLCLRCHSTKGILGLFFKFLFIEIFMVGYIQDAYLSTRSGLCPESSSNKQHIILVSG